jgi:hypothetical protein
MQILINDMLMPQLLLHQTNICIQKFSIQSNYSNEIIEIHMIVILTFMAQFRVC